MEKEEVTETTHVCIHYTHIYTLSPSWEGFSHGSRRQKNNRKRGMVVHVEGAKISQMQPKIEKYGI